MVRGFETIKPKEINYLRNTDSSSVTSPWPKSTRKMKILGKQVTAARDLLGITQAELAELAGLSTDTIFKFEAGKAQPYPRSIEKIQAELERRGIEFTNGKGIGVRLNYEKAEEFARTAAPAQNEPAR